MRELQPGHESQATWPGWAEGQTKQRQTEHYVLGNQNNLPSSRLLKTKAAFQEVVETASV